MSPVVETDVLIVGSGPAGASAALALSTYGVPTTVVTRYARRERRLARIRPISPEATRVTTRIPTVRLS